MVNSQINSCRSKRKATLFVLAILLSLTTCDEVFVINTWPFVDATEAAYSVLSGHGSAVDAVVAGCSKCEVDQCDGTVGWGGISPDEDGHVTLDALVMEGTKQDMGAVIQLKSVREASKVARAVLKHSYHSVLVGENATNFAISLGFQKQTLSSEGSTNVWRKWKEHQCQPNFWKNMVNSTEQCGPYQPEWNNEVAYKTGTAASNAEEQTKRYSDKKDHDTIGMIALDGFGGMAVGTSTNGKSHKMPGRASDSALPGCGAYVDNDVGGAVATGDGDIMMRFSPAFLAVELIRAGLSVQEAAHRAVKRISDKYPGVSGAVVAASRGGEFGAACSGMDTFTYSCRKESNSKAELVKITCSNYTGKAFVLYSGNNAGSYIFSDYSFYLALFILSGGFLIMMIFLLYFKRNKETQAREVGIKLIWNNPEKLFNN